MKHNHLNLSRGALSDFQNVKWSDELTSLDVSHNHLRKSGLDLAASLKDLSHLQRLYVGYNNLGPEGAQAFFLLQQLSVLDLRFNHLGPQGIATLGDAALTDLRLCGNDLRCHGASDLANALKKNYLKCLTRLDLSDNKIGLGGATALGRALESNRSILHFNLSCNVLLSVGAERLVDGLMHNNVLQELALGHNLIKSPGAVSLAKFLKVNQSLTMLHVNHNVIDRKGWIPFADALKTNTSLKRLNASGNLFFDDAGLNLAEALKLNRNLTHLSMRFCSLGPRGRKALAEALTVNQTLKYLDLSQNHVLSEGSYLCEALKVNRTLTHLLWNGCNLPKDGARTISDMLTVNVRLRHFELAESFASVKDASSLIADALATSGRAIRCLYVGAKVDGVCVVNCNAHQRTQAAVIYLICMRRRQRVSPFNAPKEILLMLGQFLWTTRRDLDAWK